jgi:pimeloyl-ACP methyl ester carboxylesterase
MMARLLRFCGLALLGLLAGGVLWMPADWSPWWVLLLPLGLLALLAAVLAGEFAWLWATSAAQPAPPPTWPVLVAAWWQELGATLRLALWRMPTQGARDDPPDPAGPTILRGLVLVHGYGCNRGLWEGWLKQLAPLQVPCVAVNLEPLFASIAEYGPIIEAAVADLQRQTGRAPILVAHSMGGLAARIWWTQDPTARRLHQLITIGSPHQGTRMAQFGWGANARQMRPQSSWLAGLQALQSAEQTRRTLCFHSDCDNLVFPSAAATLPGADNRQVTGAGHVAMVDHPEIFAAALRGIRHSD